MSKLVKGFFLNWHLALDTTITHYFVINLALVGHFELAAAVSVGDSLLKLALALPGSIAASWTRPSVRVDWCVLFRATLVASWLTAISLLATNGPGVVVAAAFIIFKGIAIIDNALSADFQFFAKDALGLDLSQTTSIQNIIARASLAAAPAFALYLIKNKFSVWHLAPMTVIFLCIGISTLRSIQNITPSQEISEPSPRHGYRHALNFTSIINSSLMRWGLIYQLTVNFAFAGVTYLLMIDLKPTANAALNGLSALYFLFFTYQIVVLVAGDKAIPAKKLDNIVHIVFGTSVLSITLGTSSNFWLGMALCAAIGLLYAFELVAVQKVLISKLKGPRYLEYSALSKVCARIASAASVTLLGLGVGMGIPPSSLLIVCGSAGLCSALLLKKLNPEREWDGRCGSVTDEEGL